MRCQKLEQRAWSCNRFYKYRPCWHWIKASTVSKCGMEMPRTGCGMKGIRWSARGARLPLEFPGSRDRSVCRVSPVECEDNPMPLPGVWRRQRVSLGAECCVGFCTERVRDIPCEPGVSGTGIPLHAKWPGCVRDSRTIRKHPKCWMHNCEPSIWATLTAGATILSF